MPLYVYSHKIGILNLQTVLIISNVFLSHHGPVECSSVFVCLLYSRDREGHYLRVGSGVLMYICVREW